MIDLKQNDDNVRNVIIVRLNKTEDCMSVSDFFPSNSHPILAIDKEPSVIDDAFRIRGDDGDESRKVDIEEQPVIVFVYNIQTDTLCNRQRKRLDVVTAEMVSSASSSPLHIFSMCPSCAEQNHILSTTSMQKVISDNPKIAYLASATTRHRSSDKEHKTASVETFESYVVHNASFLSIQNTSDDELSSQFFWMNENSISHRERRHLQEDESITMYGIGVETASTAAEMSINVKHSKAKTLFQNSQEQNEESSYSMIGNHTQSASSIAAVSCSTDFGDECCNNQDCSSNNLCVNRNCIEEGYPRFTLEWFGYDDYDLIVTTPSGVVLSFVIQYDPTTGGRVGEGVDQTGLGFHTENTYFPVTTGAPLGVYTYSVQEFVSNGISDEWTLSIHDERGEVTRLTGNGPSGDFLYQRTTTSAPALPLPPTQPPGSRPCTSTFDECCTNSDCIFDNEICVNRNCIAQGNPRFTLYWEGDDDIDLFVTTPGGEELSFVNVFDPLSGGRLGEETDQFGSGFHVENVFFPHGLTLGTFTFVVRPISTFQEVDEWTVDVVDNGQVVASESGYGPSSQFSYRKTSTPANAQPLPTLSPVQQPSNDPSCSIFFDECCSDSDCPTGLDLCVQKSCIRRGNPRFTLTWNGNDDLDLFVTPPLGSEISSFEPFDALSGGSYEDDGGQSFSGPHVESVYFPISGAPSGRFTYGVRSSNFNGFVNPWTLHVYEGGQLVDTQVGSGQSVSFTYLRNGFDGPQRPQPTEATRCSPFEDECCLDSDCDSDSEICVQRICIDEGFPRITLTWSGDDDLDLSVVSPNGVVLSGQNTFDSVSGGRFDSDGDQSEFGLHVETVYFPDIGGSFKFFVTSVNTRGVGPDEWNLAVYEGNTLVQGHSGFRDSKDYYYQRNNELGDQCPNECCADYDCSSNQRCVQRSCISDGALRFTLTWTGNDNIDLEVVTPDDTEIWNQNLIDETSGGFFEDDPARGGFGFHVENTVFTGSNIPSGEYLYVANSRTPRGTKDYWELRVYAFDELVSLKTGQGDSVSFSYFFDSDNAPRPTASPSFIELCEPRTNECCIDSDCGPLQVCIQRICITEGNPRFTLQWTGDDDLDLAVRTPLGSIISLDQDDPVAKGFFEPDGDQFGFGLYAESVHFEGDTTGLFEYSVDSFLEIGNADQWKVSVFVDGLEVDSIEGTGSVRKTFLYMPNVAGSASLSSNATNFTVSEGKATVIATNSSLSEETTSFMETNSSAVSEGTSTIELYTSLVEETTTLEIDEGTFSFEYACVSDNDCIVGLETCVNQVSCVSLGDLRFTLTWTGDDILELEITSPSGSIVSLQQPIDETSGGVYEADSNQSGGGHVENVVFESAAIEGIYKYTVKTFLPRGTAADQWSLAIFVNNTLIETKEGEGDSDQFEVEVGRG